MVITARATMLTQAASTKMSVRCFLRLFWIFLAVTILATVLINLSDILILNRRPATLGLSSQFVFDANKCSNKSDFSCKLYNKDNRLFSYVNGNTTQRLINISQMMRIKKLDCQARFNTRRHYLKLASISNLNAGSPIEDEAYLKLTSDCREFRFSRGYIMSSLTPEEEDFPLAFSMLVYKDAEMVERLLRAIYRPQNYYCIHVDSKSPDVFYKAVSSIVKCFPNVFLTSRRIEVHWGRFSVLEPDLVCMEELWRYPRWKYFMSLTGQEFPLKTNFELVKILTAYDGANDIQCLIKRANVNRWRNTSPPFGIRPIKGAVHITVNRDYVDYVLHNKTARALLEWVKQTRIPDETFFATLHCNPQLGIRGSYIGHPDFKASYLSRFKYWYGHSLCAGRYVHGVCILSTGDLPQLGKAKHLIANKFHLDKDRIVVACLEEKIFNDTRDEYLGVKTFNTERYASSDFVRKKVN